MMDTVTLHKGEPARTGRQFPPKPRKRILVVDDEPLLRQLYTEVLTHADYEVDTAEDGSVAWDALQANGYDLLVTDNDMPKVTGVALLKKFHAAHMTLPVIMVTGNCPDEEFLRYPWLQPGTTLLKPYSVVDFLRAVKEALFGLDDRRADVAPPPVWQSVPLTAYRRI